MTHRSDLGVWLVSILLGIGWLAAGASERRVHAPAEETSEREATAELVASPSPVVLQRAVAGSVGERCSREGVFHAMAATSGRPTVRSRTSAAEAPPARGLAPRLSVRRLSAPARAPPS
jgi:hypothetical protein